MIDFVRWPNVFESVTDRFAQRPNKKKTKKKIIQINGRSQTKPITDFIAIHDPLEWPMFKFYRQSVSDFSIRIKTQWISPLNMIITVVFLMLIKSLLIWRQTQHKSFTNINKNEEQKKNHSGKLIKANCQTLLIPEEQKTAGMRQLSCLLTNRCICDSRVILTFVCFS